MYRYDVSHMTLPLLFMPAQVVFSALQTHDINDTSHGPQKKRRSMSMTTSTLAAVMAGGGGGSGGTSTKSAAGSPNLSARRQQRQRARAQAHHHLRQKLRRRAELVLKSTKGFLMEHARYHNKDVLGGGGVGAGPLQERRAKTVQFWLPTLCLNPTLWADQGFGDRVPLDGSRPRSPRDTLTLMERRREMAKVTFDGYRDLLKEVYRAT